VIKLPPKWKMAKDSKGRPYYYHMKSKVSQWVPPSWDEDNIINIKKCVEELTEVEIETASTDNSEDYDEAEESDEEEDESEDDEKRKNTILDSGSDLSAHEKELLLKSPKRRTKEERQHERRQKRERDREKREYERKRRRERHGKHRRDGLVQEYLIPKRNQNEKNELMTLKEIKDHLKKRNEREEAINATFLPMNASSLTAIIPVPKNIEKRDLINVDGSSDNAKRIKEKFLKEASKEIVKVLDPYFQKDSDKGIIKTIEDFKHLAKKLNQFVMMKELKHCKRIEDLKFSDSVKKKATDYIKKYMARFGDTYKRSPLE